MAGAFKLEEGLPCSISILPIKQPAVWPRNPPLAERLQTSWLEITVTDDRNMQIRQKIAAVGLTTVRLIRHAVGPWKLGKLKPGEWKVSSIPTEWLEYSADKI